MSNKKFRTPAEGAEAPSQEQERRRADATARLEKIADEYYQLFHRVCLAPDDELRGTDNAARGMAEQVAGVMYQIVSLTGAVLSTIDAKQLRQIVGAELKLPERLQICIRNTDYEDSNFLETPGPTEDEKAVQATPPAKRPRGAKHPLVGLIDLAIKAGRLFDKIMRGTNPNAFNRQSLKQKEQADWEKAMSAPIAT